ncbi:MAG: MarR family transcriptional regulator [Hyphomicrobiales bacterium]|nr:MAG: MarR family transcriptional regulator [Hyphomicrobiales bacterium]
MATLSQRRAEAAIFGSMSNTRASSTLYRLIEAGQLTRKALLTPVLERGLEPGDDAVLFVLHDRLGASEEDLANATGIPFEALEPRLARLVDRDLVTRQATGPELVPGLALTERGERIREVLEHAWSELEAALLGELPPRERKKLRRQLGRFVELLRL